MKIQSELIGNYKKQGIKSLYDNKIGTINRNIDAVRYEGAQNTCAITNAIHAEGEATRALINANAMQELRDKLEARDRDVMVRDFQLSQLSQTASLVGELRPIAKPAYITCSPYTTTPFGCGAV